MTHFKQGNFFWKTRSKHGRDKLFATPELMWNAACEYFQWCEDNPLQECQLAKYRDKAEIAYVPKVRAFTLEGLCQFLNCDKSYLRKFESNNIGSSDFITIITRIRETIYCQQFTGAASGLFNANIISRKLGLAERQEMGVTLPPVQEINPTTDGRVR